MVAAAELIMVFRLGTLGLSLPVGAVTEVCRQPRMPLAQSASDGTAGSAYSVQTCASEVPLGDLAHYLGLPLISSSEEEELTYIVFNDPRGAWAALVDRVEGIFPASAFIGRSLPRMMACEDGSSFESLDLWRDEVLVRLDPLKVPFGAGQP